MTPTMALVTAVGVDASFSHQSAQQLHNDNVKAIGRYCGPADAGKVITYAELKALNGAGVAVWLVYEAAVQNWRRGYAQGLHDGSACRSWASRTLWWPNDRPIYSAFDENVGPADHDTFVAYQRGFNDGQAAAGAKCGGAAYADGYVLAQLHALGLIVFTWLSDSTAFYGSHDYAASGAAFIVQYYGRTLPGLSGIDVDDLLVVDFGQVPAPTSPVPQPPAHTRSDRMIVFFRCTDAPSSAGISHDTVYMAEGFEARALGDMDEVKYWSAIAQLNGTPKAAVDPDKIGTMPWARVSRLRPFAH